MKTLILSLFIFSSTLALANNFWVVEFSDNNGGGHMWSPQKISQDLGFKCDAHPLESDVFNKDSKIKCTWTGRQLRDGEIPCTGFEYEGRACLPDYSDVSLYLNRDITSEIRPWPRVQFNSYGYLNRPKSVLLLESYKDICCSGKAVIAENMSSDDRNNGMICEQHVYCVPADWQP